MCHWAEKWSASGSSDKLFAHQLAETPRTGAKMVSHLYCGITYLAQAPPRP